VIDYNNNKTKNMLPVILAAVGGYLIYDSLKSKKFADGGMMADGGYGKPHFETKEGMEITKKSETLWNAMDEKQKLDKLNFLHKNKHKDVSVRQAKLNWDDLSVQNKMLVETNVYEISSKMADGGIAKGGKYEVLSPDGFTIEFDKPYYTSKKKAYEAFDKWKKRYEAQGYYSSNNGRIPLDELEEYMTIRELDGGKKKKLPKHLEEKLEIIAKWCDINVEDVIGYLDAMIDSGLTYDDLKINPTKNTRFQRERAIEKKIKEIWEKIEPNYKGRLKGNHYYGVIKEIISSGRLYSNDSGDLLKDFKSYRNK
jgi:hypothetical protein